MLVPGALRDREVSMLMPEPDRRAHGQRPAQRLVTGAGFRRVRAPAIGVVVSGHGDLVAVVDAWGSGQRQLQREGQAEGGHIVAEHGQRARRVV